MPKKKRHLRVFLSYARQDTEKVENLYLFLRNEGVDVWMDKKNLLPGADWEYEIRKTVRESDIVIVCLSKKFSTAGYKQKEVRLALETAMEKTEGEIFIIPGRLEKCETLESLRKWHWVDLFEENGYGQLMLALSTQAAKSHTVLNLNEIKRKSYVRELMSKQLVSVERFDSIDFARRLMNEKKVHSVLIPPPAGGRVWGIFTKSDLLIALASGEDLNNISVSDYASRVIYVAHPEWTREEALNEMVRIGIKHLPVFEENGKIVGMISCQDILNY